MPTTVADYIDRRVDVAAFQGTQEQGEVLLLQALAEPGGSGKVATGLVKLGQRFLLELLTEQGSMPFQTTRGSTFMTELRTGRVRTPADLSAAFHRALINVRRNLIADELDDDPGDERYESAEIAGLELTAGEAKLYIRLTSLSNDPAAIIPLAVTV